MGYILIGSVLEHTDIIMPCNRLPRVNTAACDVTAPSCQFQPMAVRLATINDDKICNVLVWREKWRNGGRRSGPVRCIVIPCGHECGYYGQRAEGGILTGLCVVSQTQCKYYHNQLSHSSKTQYGSY